jgi:hypothetical protein
MMEPMRFDKVGMIKCLEIEMALMMDEIISHGRAHVHGFDGVGLFAR